jgi:hypothetical protein
MEIKRLVSWQPIGERSRGRQCSPGDSAGQLRFILGIHLTKGETNAKI